MNMKPMVLPMLSIVFFLSEAHAQSDGEKWDLKADFELINRCSQAARLAVGAANLYPSNKKARDEFLEEMIGRIKQTDQLGTQMPSEFNLLVTRASVDGMLAKERDLKESSTREWLMMQAAATCTLHSSRSERTTSR